MVSARTSKSIAAALSTVVALALAVVPAGAAEPSDSDHGGGHATVGTATVNGAPFKGGSRRLSGCSIEVAVAGLEGTAPHELTATIRAMQPTGTGIVFEQKASEVAANWTTGEVFLGDALAPYRMMANGYHLRVSLAVDGTVMKSAPYWLACGATQHEGSAWWVQFQVEWKNVDGSPATVEDLPANFELRATSERGSASCRHDTSGQLLCSYIDDAHGEDDGSEAGPGEDQEGTGHESGGQEENCQGGGGERHDAVTEEEGNCQGGQGQEEGSEKGPRVGLRVPGLGTFFVELIGLPAGWAVDERTVGEFVALAAGAVEGEQGNHRELTHTVVVRAQPLPALPEPPPVPPDPVAIVPVSAPAPEATSQTEVLGTTEERPMLPVTGGGMRRLMALAVELIAVGVVLMGAGRRHTKWRAI